MLAFLIVNAHARGSAELFLRRASSTSEPSLLKSKGRVPPGIRTIELEKRPGEELTALGCRKDELPSRRTFLRHLDDLRALLQPADGTLWHFRDGVVIGISDQEQPTTNEEDDMQAAAMLGLKTLGC